MIVLYTCNVRNINPMLDVGCLKLTIEPGYLSKIHMDTVLPPIADKIVDSKYANQVKEWIMMTKVARLFEEEKMEAVRRVEMEKNAALEKANIEKLQTLQALKKAQQEKLALKLLLKGQSSEEISAKTGLPIAALNQIKN